MKKINLRINSTGKIYSYEAQDIKPNEAVLVETDQIVEEARVLDKPSSTAEAEEGTGKILRTINAEDRRWCCTLKNQAREYVAEAQKKVIRHGLDMKILDADLSFDQKKLTFYFSAKGRVDFRGLVLDMAKTFYKLIRLQQVSSRDEAKYFGGIGKCGRELCCSKFLQDTEAIATEIAQSPELTTGNMNKSTGCCGKPMCCLSFEEGKSACPKRIERKK